MFDSDGGNERGEKDGGGRGNNKQKRKEEEVKGGKLQ